MKTLRFTLTVLAIGFIVSTFTSVASAQATRTWVSGVGDDANPCSRTAPCKTFAGAISKTAALGEIDCLDPGGFGGVTITKAITIDCGFGGFGSVLVSGTNAIIINANTATDSVTIRNLSINGVGTGLNGIEVLGAKRVHIENVRIFGFTQSCIDTNTSSTLLLTAQDTTLSECADGIKTLASSSNVVAADYRNVRVGTVTNAAINAQNGSRVVVTDSTLFASAFGVLQSNNMGNGSLVTLTRTTLSLNTTAMQSFPGMSMAAFGNVFAENGTAFVPNGGTIFTGGDNSPFQNGSIGSANGGTITKM